ncbi:hypothetical protein CMEL01_03995 [Colletotrichum melonis]|uniref:Uncharacterized protein n=1 Tax=Colletotrichum melonis TaxID=1209925 RepID=A0AAI9UEX8_9PEZI|nr:hypothetical protein CMEL01_03995 [Colletotrichum melonis]
MLRGSDSLSRSTMLSLALSVVLFPTRPTPVTHLGAVRRPHGKRQARQSKPLYCVRSTLDEFLGDW